MLIRIADINCHVSSWMLRAVSLVGILLFGKAGATLVKSATGK
jgi:hypothetical protein